MRGFTQPLAVFVGILVCAVIGYALASGLSYQRNAAKTPPAKVKPGRKFSEPVRPAVRSEEPPGQDAIRPPVPEDVPEAEDEKVLGDGYLHITFARLSNYKYEYPDPDDPAPPKDQIPDAIEALHGKDVAFRGFMLPVKTEGKRVTEFLLMKDQSACCFGVWPQMNEWIHVILKEGESAPMVWDIPITVFGTLEVGEVYEKKILMSIYRLRYHKLVQPK